MKKILIFVGVAVTALLILASAKDLIIKVTVEKVVSAVTGLRLDIGAFKVGLLNGRVYIRDMKLYNPAGFKDKVMFDIPQIYVDYSMSSALRGKIRLSKVRIELKEFIVVRSASGRLNLDSLKVVQAKKRSAAPQAKKPVTKAPEIRIDVLELKIGRALYKDYLNGPEPSVKEFNVNIDERYTDIDDPYSVVSIIVVKAMANTTIAGITGFDLQGLMGTVAGTLAGANKVVTRAVETAETAAKHAQAAVKTAQSAAKKTGDAVKDMTKALKNPFDL
jgi:uncharacterized protein involved in outer membrane biogenesis